MAERKPFLLRIDADLWAELESWAQAELRSVNGQIEYLLRDAVQRRRGASKPAQDDSTLKHAPEYGRKAPRKK